MPAPDVVLWATAPGRVLAYGPAPGVELIPYFLALLGWVGLALAAVVVSPVRALFRRLRRPRPAPPVEPEREPVPESPGDANQHKA